MEKENLAVTKPELVLIEQTAKKWKKIQLIGVLLFVIGGVAMLVSPNGFTILMFFAGAGVFLYGKFGAWWHHK
jgi:uncharacterized membrane protein HdeD (DUF308 family)